MAFPPQFLEELRAQLALSDVVAKRLRLIRAGREYKAPCPFHNEKTPSFYVNDQKGFFHCFGCGAHGDIVGFLMRHDNLTFPEAVEQLAAEAGMVVPQSTPEERKRFERQKSLHDLVEATCRWFEQQLFGSGGRDALDYLRGRGLDDDTIGRFRLGFAPADGGALRLHLARAGFAEADMVEAGVLKRPDDGRSPYSFFRNRVMFPVADRRGRVVAFGGRILEGDGPKYVNSAENPLFHKGRLLYNMSRARQAAADGEDLIVVEGYMDVIALVRAGFNGAVAPLGTALTDTQILELWKMAPAGRHEPILCFDGDNAGQRAAFRAVERVLPHLMPDHSVRIAFMDGGDDPDSLLRKHGRKAMDEVLAAAKPLADVLWRMEVEERTAEGRTLNTPEARAGLKAALEERVKQIADRTVQQFYFADIRNRLDGAFRSRPERDQGFRGHPRGGRWQKGDRWKEPLATPQDLRRPPLRDWADHRERILLGVLIHHPELFGEVDEQLGEAEFLNAGLNQVRIALMSVLSEAPDIDPPTLIARLRGEPCGQELDDLLNGLNLVLPDFAKTETPLERVRAGWQEIWTIVNLSHLKGEIERVKQDLIRETTPENWIRLQTLKEIQSAGNEFDDAAAPF
jgi:DNA primase